ncbi:hypothetical protein ACVWXO_000894 [Bradyrhizobium sp. LM2.7]
MKASPDGYAQNHAIGRSRGGLTTKIHMADRGLGCPIRFFLTTGQADDAAYDSDALRSAIAAKGAEAVKQPLTGNQISAQQASLAERHLVARRNALRKDGRSHFAVVTIAAALLWLR